MEGIKKNRQSYRTGPIERNRRYTDKNSRKRYAENGPAKYMWISAFLFTSLLILLLIAAFFLENILTVDQRNVVHLLFCLFTGLSTIFLGGSILMKLNIPVSPKVKMTISATVGIFMFLLVYFQPPFWFAAG